jgi:hypothetical protein
MIDMAAASGHATEPELMLYTMSHNAEFYAAGRLEYDVDGQLVEHYGAVEIAEYIQANGQSPVLVIVPNEYNQQLSESDRLVSQPLSQNGDLTISSVSLR